MAATAVICLGNRYLAADDLGCRVYDYLATQDLPGDIELIDGGLCGLDLLNLVEGRQRVVFVDAVAGIADAGAVVVLSQDQVAAYAGRYGHAAGLPYLLGLLPQVCAAPLPHVALVGGRGGADGPAPEALAARCLQLAMRGAADA